MWKPSGWWMLTQKKGSIMYQERVSWVWDVTLKQDAIITEDNQAGILSSHYQAGPYSEQEMMNLEFTRWYLDKLSEQTQ